MKNCLGVKYVEGVEVKCPERKICARASFLDNSSEFFDVLPYNFEDLYCGEFIWKGIFKDKKQKST